MNRLEHYIKEVHVEEDMGDGYVRVEVTINCYGSIERKERQYPKRQWESIKERGYFME